MGHRRRLLHGLLAGLLALVGLIASGATAADATLFSVGYSGYDAEPRLQLEADVPLGAIGRARGFAVEGRVSDEDVIDLQFVLKHDPAGVESLREVRVNVCCLCAGG